MTETREATVVSLTEHEKKLLREGIAHANLPALLLVLTQLTGDSRWIEPPFTPSRAQGLDDNDTAGLSPELQQVVRDAAVDAVVAWREGTPVALPEPDPELVLRMVSTSVADSLPDEYAEMYADRLQSSLQGALGVRPRSEDELDLSVVIIGAGLSGLCAAVKFAEAGVPFTIVDKASDVGGVWLTNQYPGAGVDTPSHLYSFSFLHEDWKQYFSARDQVVDYARKIADSFDIRPHIQFNTRVIHSDYDDELQVWTTTVQRADGSEDTIRSKVLLSAVGAFGSPRWPDLPGLDAFPGPVVHSAEYPNSDLDLRGKRVAVIGNGASAMQLVPAITEEVDKLYVFQRSRQWIAPFDKWRKPISEALQFLFREVPFYESWYRLRLGWIFDSRTHASLQKDPDWPHPERAVNKLNDSYRKYFTDYTISQLAGHEELIDAVVPDYPPFGKRLLLDNGWFWALRHENVQLVPHKVTAVSGDKVITPEGEYPVDVIIVATGFNVTRFLSSVTIRGKDGQKLDDEWDGDNARAYLGMTVPGFPNFFMVYGPNTQLGHGGSLLTMVESQVRYIVETLKQMSAADLGSVEVRREVYEDYNTKVDAAHEKMIWTHEGMSVYYRNTRGRVVVTNPFRAVDFWHMTRHPQLSDYALVARKEQ